MGSIPDTDEMAPMIAQTPILENGTDTPKYKRRRVSAVRDFPPGCGPNAPPATVNGHVAIGGCSENADTGIKKENGELQNVDKTTYVLHGGEIQPIKDEHADANHYTGVEIKMNPCSSSKTLQVDMEIVIKEPSQEPLVDLTDVKQEIPTGASNGTMEIEARDADTLVKEEKMVAEENSLPYYPIPSNFVWKERTYPPRRRVSAVRNFPAGCGTNQVLEEKVASDRSEANARVKTKEINDGKKHEQSKQVDVSPIEAGESEGKDGKEVIVYRKDKGKRKRATIFPAKQVKKTVFPHQEEGRVIVYALMAAKNHPQTQICEVGKPSAPTSSTKGKRRKKCIADKKQKLKSVATEVMEDAEQSDEERTDGCEIVVWDEDRHTPDVKSRELDVSLPPFGASNSRDRGIRNKVRETLRLFQVVLRKLLQEQETIPKEDKNPKARIDLQAAKFLKNQGKYINTGAQIIGPVPGVEVGDEFHYRVELMMIGLHRQSQAGIDCTKVDGKVIATSIVASGGYDNDVDNSDVLTFSGQGGNVTGGDKKPEDQKLERGNLGLKNSIDERNFVRVIRGVKETKTSEIEGRPKVMVTYTYDGLYTVERYWPETGQHGNKVYKFELKRIPNQPELAWKKEKQSKNSLCVDDISEGKERFPIRAINTLDDEKPLPFTYITRVMYPDWCKPLPLQGCRCTNGCSDSNRCPCVDKNGGEIPFNFDGAIVESKPLVFECGPSCKCPASCHNRVSQHGIRFQLEIFKTKHRGWGVRSPSSIPSGSFICEYIGELLEDKEAEKRTGSDEYLFDIGQEGLSGPMPDVSSVGFTIDALQYGNVGRFINHSCSPNLYAQNVLYDHDDRRIPHVMLFSAENIPPLQELTYHYNYTIGQVFDKDGTVKVKNCYCGSSDCPGRLY